METTVTYTNRCPARESGGYQCELEAGHGGGHYISDETIARAIGWLKFKGQIAEQTVSERRT